MPKNTVNEIATYKSDEKETHFFNIDVQFPQKPYNTTGSAPRKTTIRQWDYKIYPLNHLADLLQKLGSYHSSKTKIRYIVDANYRIWFALEGSPSKYIPGHSQMIDRLKTNAECITAGNIVIEEGKCQLINNKTGDFHVDFDSIQWALAILLKHEQELPSNFLPDSFCIKSVKDKALHVIDKKGLIDYLQPYISSPKIAITQEAEIKQEAYSLRNLNANWQPNFFPSQSSQLVTNLKRRFDKLDEFTEYSEESAENAEPWEKLADNNQAKFQKVQMLPTETSETAKEKEALTPTTLSL